MNEVFPEALKRLSEADPEVFGIIEVRGTGFRPVRPGRAPAHPPAIDRRPRSPSRPRTG